MEQQNIHEKFMEKALMQARKAFDAGEVPIGAVVASKRGEILGTGYNQVEQDKTQTAHAELLALHQATETIQDWRLDDCILYVTLEPCTMCFAAARLSRIKLIVFGADSPLFGYKKDLDCFVKAVDADVTVLSGVKKSACSELLQTFFKRQRER